MLCACIATGAITDLSNILSSSPPFPLLLPVPPPPHFPLTSPSLPKDSIDLLAGSVVCDEYKETPSEGLTSQLLVLAGVKYSPIVVITLGRRSNAFLGTMVTNNEVLVNPNLRVK